MTESFTEIEKGDHVTVWQCERTIELEVAEVVPNEDGTVTLRLVDPS